MSLLQQVGFECLSLGTTKVSDSGSLGFRVSGFGFFGLLISRVICRITLASAGLGFRNLGLEFRCVGLSQDARCECTKRFRHWSTHMSWLSKIPLCCDGLGLKGLGTGQKL